MTADDAVAVSVVVPAHQAAATLAETLDSLLAQTAADWEAVVVDDGSTDATGAIAAAYAGRDARIRVVTQAQAGEGGARNAGIAAARGTWLLFLDADDWIAPHALARFLAAAADDVDAVLAGWVRVTADGATVRDPFVPDVAALFPTLARFCPFAIHACLVRRAVVDAVGGFERDMPVGADWDFWQRAARAGARFATVDDVLAFYRVRPQSAAVNVPRLVEAGRRLIALGHAADPRVAAPDPRWAAGMPPRDVAGALLRFVCWPAGILIGGGADAVPLLAAVGDARDAELEPSGVAHSLFWAALLPDSVAPARWAERWPAAAPRVRAFLDALERQSGARDLAARAHRALERLVLQHAAGDEPLTIGAMHRVRLDVAAPLADVAVDPAVDRLVAMVRAGGDALGEEPLGTLELPACDGLVPAAVIADAVADQLGWALLGRYFRRAVYPSLALRAAGDTQEAWRGSVRLAAGLAADATIDAAALHDAVGWAVLLQEAWGEPALGTDEFYAVASAPDVAPTAPRVPFELSAPLADLPVGDVPAALVELRVGGAAIALVPVPVTHGVVAAATLRARATAESGYELARAVIRAALVGWPIDDPTPLRARLAAAAARVPGNAPLPAWAAALADGALVLARHDGPVGSPVSRRAALPAAAADALRALGPVHADPGAAPGRVLYVPELLRPTTPPAPARTATTRHADAGDGTEGFDRHYFETLFAAERDPWSYATPYEELKYEQTIAMIEAGGGTGRVLELACAEGMFTERLAPRVGELLATDIAQIAVDRTAARCAGLPNVRVARLDIARDAIPSGYDTIVCSEVLYYLGGRKTLGGVARKLAAALRPGGHIVTAHCNVVVDDPTAPGLDWEVPIGAKGIGEVFAAVPALRFRREWHTPLYRVQLFERVGAVRAAVRRSLPWRVRTAPDEARAVEWKPPAPHVAARFLMEGGKPHRGHLPVARTYELPILAYHSVAPAGSPAFARYRLSPAAFEEQLRYLRDSGFRSVTLDEWRRAKQAWQPLDGRAVLLTFDDGFRDFAEHAWPLLKRYGFGALVFLVTDHVGGTNAWDAAYGEAAPLLDWDTARRLQREGVAFGSHTATHRFLTALSPAEVVRETARSRATLERELGQPVDAIAYPHGAEDPAVQHLAGATGYTYGLSCRPGRSRLGDPLLALHRIEVRGDDTLHDFIARLR